MQILILHLEDHWLVKVIVLLLKYTQAGEL